MKTSTWRERNREYLREYDNKRYKNPERKQETKLRNVRERKSRKDLSLQEPIHVRFSQLKNMAKRRGINIEITKEQYMELVKSNQCSYCFEPLSRTGGGLDRLDNNRGYEIDNLTPCCQRCNVVKGAKHTPEETKVMMLALINYRNSLRKVA